MSSKRNLTRWVNSSKRYVSGVLAGALLVGNFLTPTTKVEAHTGYFMAILPSISTLSYQSLIIEDEKTAEADHLEFNYLSGTYQLGPTIGKLQSLPLTREELTDSKYQENATTTSCMFTWPSCDTSNDAGSKIMDWVGAGVEWVGNLFSSEYYNDGNATHEDQLNASRVGKELTQNVNKALSYIAGNLWTTEGHKKRIWSEYSNSTQYQHFLKITGRFANAAREAASRNVGKFNFAGSKFTITKVSTADAKKEGFDVSSDRVYMHIKEADATTGEYFLYETPRYEGNTLEDQVAKGATKMVNLFQIIALGNIAYAKDNVEVTKVEAIYKPGLVEGHLLDILNKLLAGLRDLLGTHSFAELVFNQGMYGSSTFAGLAPESWFQAADVLFWVAQVFAWLLLAFATMRFLGVQMWSTVTPLGRLNFMNGIQNILITAFLLTMVVPVFQLIAHFNELIVDVLFKTSQFNNSILNGQLFPGTLSGILLSFFFFGAEVVVNFIYILRGATICLLYGLSPIFIATFALGGRYQGVALKFLKELIGNIFVQSFHAVVLTFYGLFVFVGGSHSFFTSLVMVYAFLPMTKLFKEITGIGESNFIGGLANQVGGQAVDMLKNSANSVAEGFVPQRSAPTGGPSESKNTTQESNTSPTSSSTTTSTGGNSTVENNEALNSSKENISLSGSMAPTTTSISKSTKDTNPVTLRDGGGSVNQFGERHAQNRPVSKESEEFEAPQARSLGDRLKSGTKHLVGGAGRATMAAGFGALGSLTGMGAFNKLARHNSQRLAGHVQAGKNAIASGGRFVGDAVKHIFTGQDSSENDLVNDKLLLKKEACDFDMNKKANATQCTYDSTLAQESGIETSYQDTIDGRDYIVQEYSEDLVNGQMPDLSKINFDETTGKVLDEEALKLGIHYMSKTDSGGYCVALDQETLGVKSYNTAANGSRHTVKMKGNESCDDMNFAKYAFNKKK